MNITVLLICDNDVDKFIKLNKPLNQLAVMDEITWDNKEYTLIEPIKFNSICWEVLVVDRIKVVR